ncbi:MAG: response regulator [Bacteroidia bacterium]
MLKRVLIVEDDVILAMINRKYLERIGCSVVASVTNGPDAVIAVKEHNPDFVLMDIRLEGEMDGIDAMVSIRNFSDVSVIYVSGNSEPAIKERAEKTNMYGFLIKPLDFGALKLLIEKT